VRGKKIGVNSQKTQPLAGGRTLEFWQECASLSNSTMKTAGLIFLLLAAVSVSAQTNQSFPCCRHPIRVFGDHTTVNLTPLFQWWTHPGQVSKAAADRDPTLDADARPVRPLSAWHRITGVKAADLEYNWVVDAVIYTSPTLRTNARIILKNPPVTEDQMFYSLKAQLAEAGQQSTNAQHTHQNQVKAAQKAEARAQADGRSRNWKARLNSSAFAQLAARDNTTATRTLNEQKQWEQSRTLAEQQLAAIPAANGRYQIDWFALEIGRNKQGMPIYDLGVVDAYSP
jgi:hypothetical protein